MNMKRLLGSPRRRSILYNGYRQIWLFWIRFLISPLNHYEGFLGIDQIICQTDSPVFIPVSEINLRMTMGLIARNQYDHFYLPLAL